MYCLLRAAAFGNGYIDVWVNNAGVLAVGALEDTLIEVQTRVIQTNLLGYMYGATAALRYFKVQGRGVLINNISVGGWLPVPYGSAYSASKTGLWGFTVALQAELSHYPNIHVCGLYPAMLDTPGVQHAANYSGSVLKAAPPVFSPVRVAKAMVRLALHPQRSTITNIAAPFMRLGYALFPRLTGYIANAVFRSYFRRAASEVPGSGNLFDGNAPLTSIKGGWQIVTPAQRRRISGIGLIAASILAGAILLRKGSK
jgi:short-subunit dehydrogenase